MLTIPDTLEPLNEEHLSQVKELLCLLLQAAVAAYAVPVASLTKTAQPDNGEFGYHIVSAQLYYFHCMCGCVLNSYNSNYLSGY